MSDFLDSLIDRGLGALALPGPMLQPLVPSRFEPSRGPMTGVTGGEAAADFDQAPLPNTSLPSNPRPFSPVNPDRSASTSNSYQDDLQSNQPVVQNASDSFQSATRPARHSLERESQRSERYANVVRSDQRSDTEQSAWLHLRMDELASEVRGLRGAANTNSGAQPPSLISSFSAENGRHEAIGQIPPTQPSLRFESGPVWPPLQNVSDISSLETPDLTPTESQSASAQSPSTVPDYGRLDQLSEIASQAEAALMSHQKSVIRDRQLDLQSRNIATPIASSESRPHTAQQLAPAPKSDQLDRLLDLAGRAAMQPPPKIVPEDLSSGSRRSGNVEPTINVTIGRVEVKATREPAPTARPARPAKNPAVMTLDDYLKRRAAGGMG